MPAERSAHRSTVERLQMYDSNKQLIGKGVKTYLHCNENEWKGNMRAPWVKLYCGNKLKSFLEGSTNKNKKYYCLRTVQRRAAK